MSNEAYHIQVSHYPTVTPNQYHTLWFVGWFMVFNATFNNISVISWRSVLLVEEISYIT